MKKTKLTLEKINTNTYRAIFKTSHGRVVYIEITIKNNGFEITDCFYADRDISENKQVRPLKLKTMSGKMSDLLRVFETELDKKFYGIEYMLLSNPKTMEEYIKEYYAKNFKYAFLILIKDGNTLKTRFKNKHHRTIYLEISLNGDRGTISQCHYCDRRYKRNNALITPYGLLSISFDYSNAYLLKIANNELNGRFTDVIITENTFNFDNSTIPICGCI